MAGLCSESGSKGPKLKYHNSFINVEEDLEDEQCGQRASSCPPPGRCGAMVLAEQEEANCRNYVDGLSKKLGFESNVNDPNAPSIKKNGCEESPGAASTTASLDDVMPEAASLPSTTSNIFVATPQAFGTDVDFQKPSAQDLQENGLPSRGSLGHPELCKRPCIYFSAGRCVHDTKCSYCHMPHHEKAPKLDKRQRGALQALSHPELLGLVSQFCRPKARALGPAACQILGLLEEAKGTRLPEWVGEREARNLSKILQRMNFSTLVGLVIHHASPEKSELLSSALERLRNVRTSLESQAKS
ncbi:unnamed protein product [Effrenium voratum]|nr:unnamed protein product [Effrenium voratum]